GANLGPNQFRVFPVGGGPSFVVDRSELSARFAGGGDPNIDYQEVIPYLEIAPTPWLSFFAEVPARYLNPTLVSNAEGFSDINYGFKYALIGNENQYVTFQLRTYVPTCDADRGLG